MAHNYTVDTHRPVAYWLKRHPARIERLQQAIEENTKGEERENALRAEISDRLTHLKELNEGVE